MKRLAWPTMSTRFKERLLDRGEYNVLFGDKGNGIVFGFSANFGNVREAPPKICIFKK